MKIERKRISDSLSEGVSRTAKSGKYITSNRHCFLTVMILLRLKEEKTKQKIYPFFFIKREFFKVKKILIVFLSYKIMYTNYEFLFVDKFR